MKKCFFFQMIYTSPFSIIFICNSFTNSNYAQLTELYDKYKEEGFEVLAFPCNQFLKQEPGTSEEAQQFACSIPFSKRNNRTGRNKLTFMLSWILHHVRLGFESQQRRKKLHHFILSSY